MNLFKKNLSKIPEFRTITRIRKEYENNLNNIVKIFNN